MTGLDESDIAMGVSCVLSQGGAEEILELSLAAEEVNAFR